ncbi:MAG: glutamate-5-semialdehyde dehydrogenase [Leptospira sp.]|nr:glutamate-5-semialdehyde dehydrogenase [Leptospira sp.]
MKEEEKYAKETGDRAKQAVRQIRSLTSKKKNEVLKSVSELLLSSKKEIISANEKDLAAGREKGLSESLMDRLLLDDKRIESLARSVNEIISLPDPIGEITRGLTLPNGMELITKRVALGVLLVIYESRPNVTIDVGSLSFKSGNVCILRGGSEAIHTNLVLAGIFREALRKSGITEDALLFIENTERSFIVPLLKLADKIDLVVPRGGEALIRFVTENSLIPVVKHDKGVCNLFIDESADFKTAVAITVNSKVQRPGVCNAVENLIIHRNFPEKKKFFQALIESGIRLLVDKHIKTFLPDLDLATEEDYASEFLDLRLSAISVDHMEQAIEFIEQYSSGHTEAIVSEDKSNIDLFLHSLDSAALLVNCSTRFHDGGEFGLGAEVGISTQKMHVRGPMGLVHLTTTTTHLYGDGNIRE